MSRIRRNLILIVLVLLSIPFAVSAQSVPTDIVTLEVVGGYEGFFRENQWLPLRIDITNNAGAGVRGQLVVRPETSGSAVTSTFSTPVDLPSGARQSARLYAVATDQATQLRIELLDEEGAVLASAVEPLRRIQVQDLLSVLITSAAAGAVDLSGVRSGSFAGIQASMMVEDLPEQHGLFDAVDLLVISDVDTGTLTERQRAALVDWVSSGGHLIVTGGAAWRATSAGLSSLLPLRPADVLEVSDLRAFSDWLGGTAALNTRTLIAAGTLADDAEVLLANSAGVPLVARRSIGAGTVDFIAADPHAAPLRGWPLLPELWYTLAASAASQPAWGHGVLRWDRAAQASRILPGFDLLPDILPLVAFVVLYIALIGPVNYLVLKRMNRREWAWLTIPILIAAFTALAYVLGTNLRGTEVTINRLALVQSWLDAPNARVDVFIGMLSPQRAVYGLSVPGSVARPMPLSRAVVGGVDADATLQTARANVVQSDSFAIRNITIDAGFLGHFTASAAVERPLLGGRVTISDDPEVAGQQQVRGVVSNEGVFSLRDPVILARGVAYRLADALEPGDVVPFSLTLPGEGSPTPALYRPFALGGLTSISARQNIQTTQTIFDIMGDSAVPDLDSFFIDESLRGLENRRRQSFLSAFIRDAFGSSARADQVYLAGWGGDIDLDVAVTGGNWRTEDTTFHVIELERERVYGTGRVVVSPDQFTWAGRTLNGLDLIAPVQLRLDPGDDIVFRFMPVPSARLTQVEQLTVVFAGQTTGTRRLPFSLWDWSAQEWVALEATDTRYTVREASRFVGPLNSVEMRLRSDEVGGFFRVDRIAIEQAGRFGL